MSKREPETCLAAGPWVRTSPSYESQVFCNRTAGHQKLDPENPQHRFYDARTFAVIAEWLESEVPDERKRRKIKPDYEASQHEAAAKRAGRR